VEVLKDIPIDLIKYAVMEHIASSEWFPKPAQLRALTTERLEIRRHALKHWTEQKAMLEEPRRESPNGEALAQVDNILTAEFGKERMPESRMRPLPEDVSDAIKRAADDLKYFRLPDETDPVVQEWLRQMN
jgi:hypothetical protein